MTNEPKAPRELWLTEYFSITEDGRSDCSIPVKYLGWASGKRSDNDIHVIEHSAYEALKAENAELREALKAQILTVRQLAGSLADECEPSQIAALKLINKAGGGE